MFHKWYCIHGATTWDVIFDKLHQNALFEMFKTLQRNTTPVQLWHADNGQTF